MLADAHLTTRHCRVLFGANAPPPPFTALSIFGELYTQHIHTAICIVLCICIYAWCMPRKNLPIFLCAIILFVQDSPIYLLRLELMYT